MNFTEWWNKNKELLESQGVSETVALLVWTAAINSIAQQLTNLQK